MWWPSLCAVLHDLWLFVTGRTLEDTPEVPAVTPIPTVRPPSTEPIIPVSTPVPERPVELRPGVRYSTDHPDTVAIREYLKRETSLRIAPTDLTTLEWLAYTYQKSGRELPWLALALAPLGQWHQALRGLSMATIGLVPKTQSLMEWQSDKQEGHLGRVLSVTPDESILVQELSMSVPGTLTEQRFTAADWKELRPVFISVI